MLRKSICHPLISLFRVRNIVINNAQSVTDLIPKNVKVHARMSSQGPSSTIFLRLNHIAIATSDMSKSVAFYRDILGATVSDPVDVPDQGVTVVFVKSALDNTMIELLQPLGEKSPIARFLQKNPNGGYHHKCYEVKDINEAIRYFKAANIRCLSEKPFIGAHGKPAIFLNPKDCDGLLIEIVEQS